MYRNPMLRLTALSLAILVLAAAAAAPAEVQVETAVSPLPWDDSSGYVTNPDDYTEDGYYDASLHVEITQARRENAEFYVAHVRIKHASQLRTGLATSLGSKANKITTMAMFYNAALAINGDYFSDRKSGLVIRQGQTLREKTSDLYDLLLIDDRGDFHIVRRDEQDMLDFYFSGELNIVNVFSFGPALVIDGIKQEIPEKYSFAPHYKNPRAAIGQLGELEYVCVVVDGRSDESEGVTLDTLADFMEELGCTQAYNLDGGNSATLVLGGTIYNDKSLSGERSVSDIIYFATTVDPINW
ncbi:MAG: phosphodiester glycosidase family protein [Clostridiales bacterium]|nr:phosphodiester glycosidase family protein [Clostridiales bacterium]